MSSIQHIILMANKQSSGQIHNKILYSYNPCNLVQDNLIVPPFKSKEDGE